MWKVVVFEGGGEAFFVVRCDHSPRWVKHRDRKRLHEEAVGGSRGHDADDHVDDGVGRCRWG